MSLHLAPGPTSLDRLETAISRLQQKHGFIRLQDGERDFPAGLCALLLTEDPQRNPEVLDACVILPEALKPFGDEIARRVAGPDAAPALQQQFGVGRPPAVVFLRDGNYLGSLNGLRDWQDYQYEIAQLLSGPARPKPIGIAVRAVATPGACA
ncbi:MAG: hydrogenase [Dechloromonas sp.]|nr:MAG: hydrogenase [Dechloromonas sp.]